MQLSRAAWALPAAEKTMPGLSSRVTFLSRCTSCTVVVTPGVFPVAAACLRFRLLIKELLPTLGRPTTPAGQGSHLQSACGDILAAPQALTLCETCSIAEPYTARLQIGHDHRIVYMTSGTHNTRAVM